MKISRAWLQIYFKEKIPSAEKLSDLFTFHFSEVEGMEKKGDDEILDVKVLPDRAHYALSHKGVASEVQMLTGIELKERIIPEVKITGKAVPKITISDKGFCRRYTGRIVENIKMDESPAWLKKLLEEIGARSINPIVDLTNFVLFDIGQPLHAFDADKVKGGIIVRPAKNGEKITLLDGREIELTSADHLIADDEGPLAIAGVKGGKRAEVTSSTQRIIIESANFDPASVRKTSTKYDLRNESSKRYENEITPELALEGMNNVSALIQELFPKAVFGSIVDQYPVKAIQTVIEINPAYISERLGVEVPQKKMKEILDQMEIKVDEKGTEWKLTIPFNRLDIVIPEDVVEEVGRIYGYDKIKGTIFKSSKPAPLLQAYYVSEKIKNILIDQGFSEVYLYTFVPKGDIAMAKPLASDKAFARTNLTESMLSCLEKNALNADLLGLETIKTFEIGKTFTKEKESLMLSIGVSQVKKIKGVKSEVILKEAIDLLEKELGAKLPKHEVKINGIHAVAEISLEEMIPTISQRDDLTFGKATEVRFKSFSSYPFIVRDIALFTPESVSEKEVWNVFEKGIEKAGARDLLVRHSLFDIFKKDGKTSYAFRFVFQSNERTLTDLEANAIMNILYAEAKEKGWQVR